MMIHSWSGGEGDYSQTSLSTSFTFICMSKLHLFEFEMKMVYIVDRISECFIVFFVKLFRRPILESPADN